MGSSHTLDQLDTCFDDTHAVANAGLLLAATLAERLGIEQTADALIDLGERPGAHRPGRKLLTLVHTMIAGGDCIDDADVLRCGATSRVLGHRVMAPSTLGTFLRAFTFGHVRQLDRLTEQVLARAWTAGAGPGDGPMTMDLDSTVCEVHGHAKQGAAYGYTHTLGYHPLLATRADTGEVLHARQRTGRANTARGTARFVDELAARVRRAGTSGELTMRMDSGVLVGQDHPGLPPPPDPLLHHRPPDHADPSRDRRHRSGRLGRHHLPRRWRRPGRRDPLPGQPADRAPHPPGRRPSRAVPHLALPRLRHDRVGTTVELDQDHRRHAVVELCIRDLKAGAGLRHCPSGKFAANAAWLVIATLAHNLLRWVAAIGLGARGELVVVKTLRRTLLALPGRITRSARRLILHLPAGWPWAPWFELALARLRCVAYAT
jgi:Transposase DDE domain group 1